MKTITIFFVLLFTSFTSFGQHLGMTIKDAEKEGITIEHLDSIYISAVHSDTSLAVFKTDSDQELLINSYSKMIQDLANFLSKNNFKWKNPTNCWNRIYFNSDGSIDYFLYSFSTQNVKPKDQLSVEKQTEFNRLLNLFIKDYKFDLSAKTKFAQCSPVTYMPE